MKSSWLPLFKVKKISARTVGKEKFDGFRQALGEVDIAFTLSNDIEAQNIVKLILMDMINQETGQRGFLLSGQEASLDPYTNGIRHLEKHTADLKHLIDNAYDRPTARQNLTAIKKIIRRWEDKVANPGMEIKKSVVAGKNSNASVISFVRKGTGKKYLDQARIHLEALQNDFSKANDIMALTLVIHVSKNIVDMETGYRGFLLTGQEGSLDPYYKGGLDFGKNMEELSRLVGSAYDVGEVNEQLRVAIELAHGWKSQAAEPEIKARRRMNKVTRTSDDISDYIKLGIGKKYMDSMRRVLDEFIAEESALIIVRNEEQQTIAHTTNLVTVLGTLLALMIGAAIAWLTTRAITGPVLLLTQRIQDVETTSDFSIRLDIDTKDEIGLSASAFNALMVNTQEAFEDINTTMEKFAEGDLDARIESELQGDLDQMKTATNSLMERVQAQQLAEGKVAAENARVRQALDRVATNTMIANKELEIIYMNDAVEGMFNLAESDLKQDLPGFNASQLLGTKIENLHTNSAKQRVTLELLSSSHKEEIEIGGRTFGLISNPIMDVSGSRLGTVMEWTDRTAEVAIEKEIDSLVAAAGAGDFTKQIEMTGKEGFFKTLSDGLNTLVATTEVGLNDVIRVLGAMAKGDLTERITREYGGSFQQLKNDANTTAEKLTEVIQGIKEAATAVTSGSNEIVAGNADLSLRTEEQAASLEETASSMEEMTATVKAAADNAGNANKESVSTADVAAKGGDVVQRAVIAMEEISRSSKQIADIIGVIDEIAFQTNLLALNAAVEAARAGEQGRGFAVVAGEVRNLAQRSAEAAREIKDLIRDSGAKVEEGTQLVNESGETLKTIVVAVQKVSEMIKDINNSAAEQTSGIEQVNTAIVQMDDMTQQNAALVEQASAAGEAMFEQANRMNKMMSFFNIGSAAATGYSTVGRQPLLRVRRPASAHAAGGISPTGRGINQPNQDDEWEDF